MLFPCIILRSVVNTRQTTDHLTLHQQHNPRMSPRSKELEVDQIHRKFESTSIHGFTIPEVLILTVLGFFVLVVVLLGLQSVKRSIQELLDERRRKNRDLQYETSTPPPPPQGNEETTVQELSKEKIQQEPVKISKLVPDQGHGEPGGIVKKNGGYSRALSAPGTLHAETRFPSRLPSAHRNTRNNVMESARIPSASGNNTREVVDASRLPSATGKKWKDIINTNVVPPNKWNQSSNMMETTRMPSTPNNMDTMDIPRYPVLKDVTERTSYDLKPLRTKNRIILDAAALPPITGRRRGDIPDTINFNAGI